MKKYRVTYFPTLAEPRDPELVEADSYYCSEGMIHFTLQPPENAELYTPGVDKLSLNSHLVSRIELLEIGFTPRELSGLEDGLGFDLHSTKAAKAFGNAQSPDSQGGYSETDKAAWEHYTNKRLTQLREESGLKVSFVDELPPAETYTIEQVQDAFAYLLEQDFNADARGNALEALTVFAAMLPPDKFAKAFIAGVRDVLPAVMESYVQKQQEDFINAVS